MGEGGGGEQGGGVRLLLGRSPVPVILTRDVCIVEYV
jgi:hypothetical protein